MYKIKINSGRPLKSLFDEETAHYWVNRIAELFGDETGVVEMYQPVFPLIEAAWLTENLPQTTGPRIERPGAEYGAEV